MQELAVVEMPNVQNIGIEIRLVPVRDPVIIEEPDVIIED